MDRPRKVFLASVDRACQPPWSWSSRSAPAGLADVVYGAVAALLIAGAVIALLSLRAGRDKRIRLLIVGVILLVAGGSVFFVSNPTHRTR